MVGPPSLLLRVKLRRAMAGGPIFVFDFAVVGLGVVVTESILVYAYILMYYTKNRGFRG